MSEVPQSALGRRIVNVKDRFEIWDGGHCYVRAITESTGGGTCVKVHRIPEFMGLDELKLLGEWAGSILVSELIDERV